MARRLLLTAMIIAVSALAPVVASTEDAAPSPANPSAPAKPACTPGAVNPDGSPAANACPPTDAGDAAPPVNTIEEIYPAGTLRALLAPAAVPAAPGVAKPTVPLPAPHSPAKPR